MTKIKRKLTAFVAALLCGIVASGCVGLPDGVKVVTEFELDRYLGTWYEIARLDHSFERGLSNVTATYAMRDDGGVSVLNRGYKTSKREWEEAVGKAYFVGEPNIGQLKVSFFGPFYGGYNIVNLDKAKYQYALVVGPNRDYLWILSRTTELDDDILTSLVNQARTLGFPVDDLIYVDHSPPREIGNPIDE